MPIRIAFVASALSRGGTETFILRLGRYLLHHDCTVDIIITNHRGAWFNQADIFHLPSYIISGYNYSIPVIHAWKVGHNLAKKHYDVVFLNHDRLAQASLGMLPDTTIAIPIFHIEDKKPFTISCANSACWNVAVAVGPQFKSRASMYVPHKQIVTILNGVDEVDSAELACRIPHTLPLQLIYIGRLERTAKNVQILPLILKELCDRELPVQLSILGDGSARHWLEMAFRELALENHVTFYGTCQPQEVYRFLLKSHVLVFPSLSEGFGLVVAEAQACGCVPVASRLVGSTETCVRNGETGILVTPGEVSEFADAIEDMVASPACWAAMSQAGPQHVHEHLSMEIMGQEYLRLIHEALHGKYPLKYSRKCTHAIDWRMLTSSDYCFTWSRRLEHMIRAYLQRNKNT